jgi:1,2-diacylglycerol 3-alpha-glucosyltransferase
MKLSASLHPLDAYPKPGVCGCPGSVQGVRVANFTDTYLPRRDGVITSIRTLAGALSESGHSTLTVVPRHPDQPSDESLLRLRALPCGIADLRLSPWLLRRAAADGTLAAVAAHAPDVIHVHTPGPVGLLGVLAAQRLGLPLVQTYHTDLHAYAEAYRFPVRALRVGVRLYARRLGLPRPPMRCDNPAHARGGLLRSVRPAGRVAAVGHRLAALDGVNALLLGDADAVVVPTRAVLDRIRLPVPDDRIFLVPTGVAARPSTPAAVADFRSRHGLRADDRVVLFVGRINREKGVDLLIDAFVRVLATCPRARLVLVGALYEPKWFDSLLRRAGPRVAERIVLTGQQPSQVVAAAYAAANVFAFPSRTDTQALVLQEAALAGLPAVLVDPVLHQCGPLGGAGVRAEPTPAAFAEAIVGLLRNPGAAREIGAAAAARAGRHTPSRYAEAMLAVYAHAAAVKAGAASPGRDSPRGDWRGGGSAGPLAWSGAQELLLPVL